MALSQRTFEWVSGLVTNALERKGDISEWEKGFLEDQKERLEKYGLDTRYSAKQFQILNRVAEKIDYEPLDQEG